MDIRKKTIIDSVKHIPQCEQTKVGDDKPNTIKNISNPRKQQKIFHKIFKKIVKDYIAGGGLRTPKQTRKCYF